MRRVLLVGAGEVGVKHLDAIGRAPGLAVAAVADPVAPAVLPPGAAYFPSWGPALEAVDADLVIAAAPPGIALEAARAAARTGAAVIVEKPAAVDPAELAWQAGDERIFVGFQSHFAPGLAALLAQRPAVDRAGVLLAVRRDPGYFRGWRRSYASAGGVLHQQAIHGLALALRLMPGQPEVVTARAVYRRQLADSEDQVVARLELPGGRALAASARIDYDGTPRHEVTLRLSAGQRLRVRGRNLEAGLGEFADAPSHEQLRRAMYAAALAAADSRGPVHPCLFPLPELRRPMEVIDRVYRKIRAGHAPAPAA